jgi:hypothetical protein
MATQIESIQHRALTRDAFMPGAHPVDAKTLQPPAGPPSAASVDNLLAEVAHDLCTPV